MEERNNNGKIGYVIVIICLSVVVLLLAGYIGYDKLLRNTSKAVNESNNQSEVINDEVDSNYNQDDEKDTFIYNSSNLDFDFNELSTSLHNYITNDNKANLTTICKNESSDENSYPTFSYTYNILSDSAIDIVINKLKSAESLDKKITASWIMRCPPRNINYYVTARSTIENEIHNNIVFSLYYADDDNILLVSYKDVGYAFRYSSSDEIDNFIESLK